MANALTVLRMALSAMLLCFPAFSKPFYVLYLTAGLTDMADGWIARKTGTAGEFGARLGSRLDTAADLVFVAAGLIKLLPVMELPGFIWIWTALIAAIKGVNVLSGFVVQKRFVVLHTALNRITGALLFAFPLTIPLVNPGVSGSVVCLAATLAAIQEGHFIRLKKCQ